MPSKPILTIGIPTFNRGQLLRNCLRRLRDPLDQNADVEVIVLDNASTDNTRTVVEEFMVETERKFAVRCSTSASNTGSVANLLRGIDEAASTFYTFLGDDDAVNPREFSALLNTLRDNKTALLAIEADRALEESALLIETPRIALTRGERFDLGSPLYKSGNAWGCIYNVEFARQVLAIDGFREIIEGNAWGHLGLVLTAAKQNKGNVITLGYQYGRQAEKPPYVLGGASLMRSCTDLIAIVSMVLDDNELQRIFDSQLAGRFSSPVAQHVIGIMHTWPKFTGEVEALWLGLEQALSKANGVSCSVRFLLQLSKLGVFRALLSTHVKLRKDLDADALSMSQYEQR